MEVNLKLVKSKKILVKYKSYIILSLLVALTSFALGHTVAYNKDITWVYTNKTNTEKFIKHSAQSYDLQRRITLNYSQSNDLITECLKLNMQICLPEVSGKELERLSKEREQMISELDKINFETGNLLKEMGF